MSHTKVNVTLLGGRNLPSFWGLNRSTIRREAHYRCSSASTALRSGKKVFASLPVPDDHPRRLDSLDRGDSGTAVVSLAANLTADFGLYPRK